MITGQDEFAGDTVVYIPLFEASVNLKSLIAGDEDCFSIIWSISPLKKVGMTIKAVITTRMSTPSVMNTFFIVSIF